MKIYIRIPHWQGVSVAVPIFLSLIVTPYVWMIRDRAEAHERERNAVINKVLHEVKELQ